MPIVPQKPSTRKVRLIHVKQLTKAGIQRGKLIATSKKALPKKRQRSSKKAQSVPSEIAPIVTQTIKSIVLLNNSAIRGRNNSSTLRVNPTSVARKMIYRNGKHNGSPIKIISKMSEPSVHARKRLVLEENCKRVREFFQIHAHSIWIISIQLLQLIWSHALYLELSLQIPLELLI